MSSHGDSVRKADLTRLRVPSVVVTAVVGQHPQVTVHCYPLTS